MTTKRFPFSLGPLAGAMLLFSSAAFAQQVTIAKDSTLYAEPSTSAAGVGQLSQGATAQVIGRQGAWVNLKSAAGSGWVYSFNVLNASAGAAPTASTRKPATTATIGIRGLEKEDLKNATFDGKQLDALDGFASDGDKGRRK